MKMTPIKEITTADEARDEAIEYSNWQPDRLSWSEVLEWQEHFTALAEKFPELTEEFLENGII